MERNALGASKKLVRETIFLSKVHDGTVLNISPPIDLIICRTSSDILQVRQNMSIQRKQVHLVITFFLILIVHVIGQLTEDNVHKKTFCSSFCFQLKQKSGPIIHSWQTGMGHGVALPVYLLANAFSHSRQYRRYLPARQYAAQLHADDLAVCLFQFGVH